MPAHSDTPLIRRCRQEVRVLAAAMIGRCLDAARASLTDAAHGSPLVAARQTVQDALDRIEQCGAAMQSSFPAMLDQAIAKALDTADEPPGARQHDPGALPGDTELALLDDSELSHFVETSRLVQIVQPVVEHALARFDALMSSALDQLVVRPDLDPMRPEVLCRALMRMLDAQSGSTEVRRLWLRHFAQPYAKELNGLYDAVSDVLEQEGVRQARYRVKFTAGGVGAGSIVAAGNAVPMAAVLARGYPPNSAPAMPGTMPMGLPGAQMPEEDLSDEQAIRRRRAPMPGISDLAGAQAMTPQTALSEFLYNPQWAQQYDAPLPQDYYAAVQQQLAQMAAGMTAAPAPLYDEAAWLREQAGLRALAAADRPARAVTPEMFLSPRQWNQQIALPQARARTVMELKAQAARVSQALGIGAVRALVAQVAADQYILAPVREALVALEPSLLRLALAEPRFVGEAGHPARRFIEEIVQRSFAYNDEFAPEFEAFAEPVRQAVQVLDAIAEPSGQDFDRSLKALQADWQEQDEAEQQAREQGARVMEFAQKRQQLADRIARDLSLRPDLTGVPNAVADFLFNDWSLVIAHAQLTHERRELDPGGYLSIVTDLLWSVKRDQMLSDLTRLFDVVPRVIATLRMGLDMLDKDPRESQTLFDLLLRLHEPALKLRRMRSALDQGATLEALSAALQLPEQTGLVQPGQSLLTETSGQIWLGRGEREAAGFMDDDEGGHPDPAASAVSASALAQQEGDAGETAARAKVQLAQLQRGDRVDLCVRGQWRRAGLVWVSDNRTLYLFVSHGGQAVSMTRHTLEKLLCSNHVRPLEGGWAMDKAIKAVASTDGR